ncbi:hydantoinase B/oxoprolinase family protein [Nocardia australiensis]|uniref:hydantoinase B/oxoprolinase family protein n=1 Tax=Nocardia australiensis TaxID=2887191 RepID=UPI001D14736F|nr:hydantoinase B/oxoprolinase family protein [Nocardia australiensis]
MMAAIGDSRPALATSQIDLEILRTRIIACTEELAASLASAAPISEMSQASQFVVAIADTDGNVAAIDDAQQLGSIERTVGHVIEYFKFDLGDGDVVLTNDPYIGGTRVQEVTLVAPLIIGGELVLYLAVGVHLRDMGGQLGGNLYPDATEILAEGVLVTPMKVQRMGRPVRDVLGVFLLNGRRPDETRSSLRTAIATLELGQQRLGDLVSSYGHNAVVEALQYSQDYTERLARRVFTTWTPGSHDGGRCLSLSGTSDTPINVRLTATVEDGTVTLDFSDSDDQRPMFVNCPVGVTASRSYSVILTMLAGGVPPNSGLSRVVHVRTRPGSVVHPVFPAPCGWGNIHCGNEIADAVAEALSHASEQALGSLSVPRPLILCRQKDNRSDQTDLGVWGIGGASASAQGSGWGPPRLSARAQLQSIEQWETETGLGLQVQCQEFAQDSGGAGEHVGAPGVDTVIALAGDRLYTLWTDASSPVRGVAGGLPGGGMEIAFHTTDGWIPAPPSASESTISADFLRLRLAGGGGYGSPRDRAPASIEDDLADGLISETSAREIYQLALNHPDGVGAPMEGSDHND